VLAVEGRVCTGFAGLQAFFAISVFIFVADEFCFLLRVEAAFSGIVHLEKILLEKRKRSGDGRRRPAGSLSGDQRSHSFKSSSVS